MELASAMTAMKAAHSNMFNYIELRAGKLGRRSARILPFTSVAWVFGLDLKTKKLHFPSHYKCRASPNNDGAFPSH